MSLKDAQETLLMQENQSLLGRIAELKAELAKTFARKEASAKDFANAIDAMEADTLPPIPSEIENAS